VSQVVPREIRARKKITNSGVARPSIALPAFAVRPASSFSFLLAGVFELNPSTAARMPAPPPIEPRSRGAWYSATGPKTAMPLRMAQPAAVMSSHAPARPHHSRSWSSLRWLEMPTKIVAWM
jgi:hypothetical protein